MRRVTRSLSPVVFAAIIINLFTLGCTPETQTVYVTDVAESADVETLDTEAPDSADVTETEDTADTVENTDTATPGPSALDHECDTANDCTSPVQCGEAACYPMEGGVRKCFVFSRETFCDDGNVCTFDSCNTNPENADDFANLGCNHKPRGCDDGNVCTIDVCDPTNEDGCVSSTNSKACNDNDACTKDTCLPGGSCGYTAETCDDGKEETNDGCVPETGCYHTNVECKLASECLNPDPCLLTGCVFGKCQSQPLICDDGVPCTTDFCAGGDCAFMSNCFDDSVCSNPECNPATGSCVDIDISCNDGNSCTADGCTEGIGCTANKIAGCCLDATECNDGDACTYEFCDLVMHLCVIDSIKIDDGIACTIDSCGVGGYITNQASDELCLDQNGQPLEGKKAYCLGNVGCVECKDYTNCNDDDPCTADSCDVYDTATCEHKAQCKTPQVCIVDTSNWNGWVCEMPEGYCSNANDCYDADQCINESCVNHTCVYTLAECNDDNLCTTDYCHETQGCLYDYKECKGDACIYGQCEKTTGECSYTTNAFCVACESNSDCVIETICVGNSVVSYSGVCNNGQCFYGGVQVCQNSICHISTCQEGSCIQSPKCNDDSECTFDTCDYNTGECSNTPLSCNDYDPCTADACTENGCQHTWSNSECPAGSETTDEVCSYAWNCKLCNEGNDESCEDESIATVDICSHGIDVATGEEVDRCVHRLVGFSNGVGIGNFGESGVIVDLKLESGEYLPGAYLEPNGSPRYFYNPTSLLVVEIKDIQTGDFLSELPPGVACINQNGTLVKWHVTPLGYMECKYDD